VYLLDRKTAKVYHDMGEQWPRLAGRQATDGSQQIQLMPPAEDVAMELMKFLKVLNQSPERGPRS
jgi:hypothetical protein